MTRTWLQKTLNSVEIIPSPYPRGFIAVFRFENSKREICRYMMTQVLIFNIINDKVKPAFVLAIPFTGIQAFMDAYVFDHSGWVQAIILAVFADTLAGVIKSWNKKKFDSYRFGSVIGKTVVYAAFVFVTGGIYRIDNEITNAVATLMYSAILFREGLSFIENMEEIRPGTFPRWLVARLKRFDENGTPITDE